MNDDRTGRIAVIFVSIRNDADPVGYGRAAAAMDALAAQQPGYRGVDSAREAGGMGITISYWADDAAAIAWRDHPQHTAIRDHGRSLWYDSYSVNVARIERAYDWTRS
jgi:heme-degrading monooxygenase HmoA